MTSESKSILFFSDDRRFGLNILNPPLRKILCLCQKANKHETGGILLGAYSVDLSCATVTQVFGAPDDSEAGNSWFHRGVKGMRSLLEKLWKTNHEYYLGEWHYHPFSEPEPSHTDLNELRRIAKTSSYSCPEPLMLIIGGDPNGKWCARAFVFPNGQKLELRRSASIDGSHLFDSRA